MALLKNGFYKTNLFRKCAFCGSDLRVFPKKSITFINFILSGLMSFLLMVITWKTFDARVFLFWVFFLLIYETFIQLRWRLSILCQACGFDPVLYLRDSTLAATKVKNHLELRSKDPRFLLAPKLNLPTLTPERARAVEKLEADKNEKKIPEKPKMGRFLSKQI